MHNIYEKYYYSIAKMDGRGNTRHQRSSLCTGCITRLAPLLWLGPGLSPLLPWPRPGPGPTTSNDRTHSSLLSFSLIARPCLVVARAPSGKLQGGQGYRDAEVMPTCSSWMLARPSACFPPCCKPRDADCCEPHR